MTAKLHAKALKRMLEGNLVLENPQVDGGRVTAQMFYDQLDIKQEYGQMVVTFYLSGNPMAFLTCAPPNFAAGETLTINGLISKLDVTMTSGV